MEPPPWEPPMGGTVERWAYDLVMSRDLGFKLDPGPVPEHWEPSPPVRRIPAPGRPSILKVVERAPRAPRPTALGRPLARARLLATFHHHELQAAELFAWAVLAFPNSPRRWRRGLVAIAREELTHARMYGARLTAQGHGLAEFPVRDWFWERVPSCPNPTAFVALVGVGLEAGNLDHGERYERAFLAAGDPETAAVCAQVVKDEMSHVRFAVRWFRRFTGGLDFEAWRAALPAPLTPTVLTGRPLARAARRGSGLDEAFLDALEAWCRSPGC
jgi:uncharacterized ferritin-like protein (DUF455 family)